MLSIFRVFTSAATGELLLLNLLFLFNTSGVKWPLHVWARYVILSLSFIGKERSQEVAKSSPVCAMSDPLGF